MNKQDDFIKNLSPEERQEARDFFESTKAHESSPYVAPLSERNKQDEVRELEEYAHSIREDVANDMGNLPYQSVTANRLMIRELELIAYSKGHRRATARHEEEIAELQEENNSLSVSIRKVTDERDKLSSLLDEIGEVFEDLLNDAKYLYQYYPNAFRRTQDQYFSVENETLQKIKESRG